MIYLDSVIPTQNDVRRPQQVIGMVRQLVYDHDVFDNRDKIILKRIIVNDQAKYFIHDGHHRLLAKVLTGHNELDPSEYIVKDFDLELFKQVNFDVKWFTPYNILTHVRKADIGQFKDMVQRTLEFENRDVAMTVIKNGFELYAEPRKVHNLPQMATRLLERYVK